MAIVVGTAVALRKVHGSASGICAAAPSVDAQNLGADRALQPSLLRCDSHEKVTAMCNYYVS